MSPLADTHCHLYFNLFNDDLPDVIRRALDCGVSHMMVPGLDLETSRQAVELSDKYPSVFAAVGVHPNEANNWDSNQLHDLAHLADHPKVLAIGEIGLDFYRDRTPTDIQERAFYEQLDLANGLQRPVILHNRAASSRMWSILHEWIKRRSSDTACAFPGVLHSFEGTLEEAILAVEHKFMIGIGGPVTYKNAQDKHRLARELPLSNLILETDAPFLTPHPFRGQRNEPARILEIARSVALIRGEELDNISETTSRNAKLLFGWSTFC